MKNFPCLTRQIKCLSLWICLGSLASVIWLPAVSQAQDTNILQQTKTALVNAGDATKTALANAGSEARAGLDDLKDRAVESSPNHYTAGELTALLVIGLAVSAIAGIFTNLKPTWMGNLGRLLPGLAGAFIGGFLLRFTGLKLGLGKLVLNYDEIALALAGAIILLGLGRLFSKKSKKKAGSPS